MRASWGRHVGAAFEQARRLWAALQAPVHRSTTSALPRKPSARQKTCGVGSMCTLESSFARHDSWGASKAGGPTVWVCDRDLTRESNGSCHSPRGGPDRPTS